MSKTLELIVGSARDFEVFLLDSNDVAENISDAAAATLAIRETLDAATDVLLRTTDAGNLTIDTTNSKLVASLTQDEADALVVGTYIAQASVQMTASSKWFHTDPFVVKILSQGAPHL